MLAIRMRKMGAKKRPFYRVVVTESRSARDSAAVEILGHYDPKASPERFEVDRERLAYWVGRGARLSDTVAALLKRHKAPAPAAEVAAS
jgi:small subunit ribosomal protein S16